MAQPDRDVQDVARRILEDVDCLECLTGAPGHRGEEQADDPRIDAA